MQRFHFSSVTLGLAALAGAMLTAPARADYEIWASATGAGTYTEIASSPTAPATFGPFTNSMFTVQQLSVSGNLPGSPTSAQEFGTQLQLTSNGAASVHLIFAEVGFTAPVPPPALAMASIFSPSVTSGINLSTSSYQSYADHSPTLNSNGYTPSAGATTTGPQTLTAAPNGSTATTSVTSLSSPYSLIETLTVNFGTSGGTLNSSTTTTLTATPTPEPSTMTLAAIGSIGLLGYNLRRRKARVA
jgi:hypothetical protein